MPILYLVVHEKEQEIRYIAAYEISVTAICKSVAKIQRKFIACCVKNWKNNFFQARLQNCGKRLLVSSNLYVRPHGTTRLPLEEFS